MTSTAAEASLGRESANACIRAAISVEIASTSTAAGAPPSLPSPALLPASAPADLEAWLVTVMAAVAAAAAGAGPLPLSRFLGDVRRGRGERGVAAVLLPLPPLLLLLRPSKWSFTNAAVRWSHAAASRPIDQSRSVSNPFVMDGVAEAAERGGGRDAARGGETAAARVGETTLGGGGSGLAFVFDAPGLLFTAATRRLLTPPAGSGCFSFSFSWFFSFLSFPFSLLSTGDGTTEAGAAPAAGVCKPLHADNIVET